MAVKDFTVLENMTFLVVPLIANYVSYFLSFKATCHHGSNQCVK